MSAFTVEFDNRSGQLARLCQAMADRGVNSSCVVRHTATPARLCSSLTMSGLPGTRLRAPISSTTSVPPSPSAWKTWPGPVRRLSESSPMQASTLICFFRFECRPTSSGRDLCRESRRGCQRPRRSGSQRLTESKSMRLQVHAPLARVQLQRANELNLC